MDAIGDRNNRHEHAPRPHKVAIVGVGGGVERVLYLPLNRRGRHYASPLWCCTVC
jgi:hypothetical protein